MPRSRRAWSTTRENNVLELENFHEAPVILSKVMTVE